MASQAWLLHPSAILSTSRGCLGRVGIVVIKPWPPRRLGLGMAGMEPEDPRRKQLLR